MSRRRRWGLLAATGAVAAVLSVLPAGAPARATAGDDAQTTPTTTPIKHFIYLMQENHSFDNYFGTYPGVDGLPKDACVPVRVEDLHGPCVRPFWVGGGSITDLAHTRAVFREQFRGGANDGFVQAFGDDGEPRYQVMGYYDGRDLPYYWNVADEYVLFDRFFTSAAAGSARNHVFWVAAAAGYERDTVPPEGFGNLPMIFDRLEEQHISWKFYVQDYNPKLTYRTFPKAAQVVWVPLLATPRYLDDPRLFGKIAPIEEYYDDLEKGTLPSVVYIAPGTASEHPPGTPAAGQRFVRSLHTALMHSSAWTSSAFLWTWDDWGGWYDHVVPPQVDEYGYGYRAPALLVSPFAKKGYVDSTTLDFTSGLKFIEENWRVAPLTSRDRAATNILGAFDFSAPPREPVLLADDRSARVEAPSPKRVIYLAYGLAICTPVVLVGLLRARKRRRPRDLS
jgi:phospholipase C